jgi:cytochrome c peroxidase
MKFRLILSLVLAGVLGAGWLIYRGVRPPAPVLPIGKEVQIPAPLGLPPVPIPVDNPPTADTIALGRRLYYDPILSVNNTISCASCHSPEQGFADGRTVSEGVQHRLGTRNSPTVLNAAYYKVEFWDGRAPSLEKQTESPVTTSTEMAHTLKGVVQKLSADPTYRAEFTKAWGPRPISYEMVEKSIASFERTLLSGDSPFDRWKYGHDENAVTPAVKRGFVVFTSPQKGNCASCHTVGEKYALFTDNKFHDIGVGVDFGVFKDNGLFDVTHRPSDRGLFKTPSLRNIALTAPYMHDGSLKTLKDVMDFYIGAGNSNPNLDKEIHSLNFLTGQERSDLLEFLNSLTGTMPPDSGPPAGSKMAANQ